MLLRLALSFAVLYSCLGQENSIETILIEEKNVLSPPYFNIATGKKINTTATCGTEGPELFCKLTGGTNFEFSNTLHQGQVCDVCDDRDPDKSHPVNNAIDGTERWWQSPPLSRGSEFNHVNVTIHLGQVFHVAYVLIKFANSPRAGTWVLERSSDNGKTFQPWQYFANTDSDCYNQFGMSSLEEITRDDSVICTSDYSGVVPLENGEVIVSMIKGRPGAQNFSYATVLQEWSKATDVRLRLLRTKTLLGHLMAVSEQDPTVTRRYYYSIKDISIGGRCVCNGHADTCQPDPLDQYKLKCVCQHNTCGDSCEMCCPGFVQKAWKVAVPESTNECEACNCHGHSDECEYDEETSKRRLSLDLEGNYEGGGVCKHCLHNTAGVNCEHCAVGFWRPDGVDPRDPNGCRACECDSAYTLGSCEPSTGRCYCKAQYAGDRCDRCAPGYHDFPECRPCECYYNGTQDEVCLPINNACPCKYNFAGAYCDECAAGFFNFPVCDVCQCNGEGVASDVCDPYTGACPCSEGFQGKTCSECAPGYYSYPLCQRCHCSEIGTTDDVCDSLTGSCFCDNKYFGPSCDECREGFYGFPQCHECECTQPGSIDNICDGGNGQCRCLPNYEGERCEHCAPEFYGYPNCVPCNCDIYGSLRTTCDQQSGQCNCREYVGGRACDACNANYFNFPRCEECSCDTRGITSSVPGVCLAFTSGQCDCKENVVGRNCDQCKPLYYDLDRGCVPCNCFLPGTLDGVGECDEESGSCWCKPYTCSQRCSQCEDGFFSLDHFNYFGCLACQCDVGGSLSSRCDKNNGQCDCRSGVDGRRCNRIRDGYFHPTVYQNQYEVEYGRSPDGGPVRSGFNNQTFPGFSMNGYVQFSSVQRGIVMPVDVTNDGLYRIIFRYVNLGSFPVLGNATLIPVNVNQDGETQSIQVTFAASNSPRSNTASQPLVLNQGKWRFLMESPPGILLDYFVLLPSEYYEPSILELTTTEPCAPVMQSTGKRCLMFSHLSLSSYSPHNLVDGSSHNNNIAPSTSHPVMRKLNGAANSEEERGLTADIHLPQSGKYVIVLEYASTKGRFQTATVSIVDGSVNGNRNAKFNIYSCLYMFMCRQVALEDRDQVAIFETNLPDIQVRVQAEANGELYVKSLTLIPYEEWSMEMVEPRARCVTTEGPDFDNCIPSSYDFPVGSTRFPITDDNTNVIRPPTMSESQLVYLTAVSNSSGTDATLQTEESLNPGRYVFLVRYYNPDHVGSHPHVVVDGGLASTGVVNVSYCPNENGCVAVFETDGGRSIIDINVPTVTFTIVAPPGKAFWVEEVVAVPENLYRSSILGLAPSDQSSEFVRECSRDSFHETIDNPTDFCKENIFSLAVKYNNGAFKCNCSWAGTVGGEDSPCQKYGGQCACKPNVIGRQCDRCRSGYFNFPDCQPCECGERLCDEVSGECICPPNTVEPECTLCAPFTHSYHPLLGCVNCDCVTEGVVDEGSEGCDPSTGQCNCKERVTGQRCNRCQPGYFGFPDCQSCTCDASGSVSDLCDQESGQCLCKENIEGLQCDRCKPGSFFLDRNNPQGCTGCFCFGASNPPECHSSLFPATEVFEMEGWRVININNPEVVLSDNGEKVEVVVGSGDVGDTSSGIYWAAPEAYLRDKVASYGGELSYSIAWNKVDASRGDEETTAGVSTGLEETFDVILKGNQFIIGWKKPPSGDHRITLSEHSFKMIPSGNQVTREVLMMVLADLESLHILAAPHTSVSKISLRNVVMTTTDYSLPVGSAPSIPGVEECLCPEGYRGHSCQYCDVGYYREQRGPYLGYCKRCDCYGHCEVCDAAGQTDGSNCIHNTGGPKCGVCKDGYIGNATSGRVDACTPCPCPYTTEGGNFADSCEYGSTGEVICHCKEGYSGEKCDQCAMGYFGNPTSVGGSCQQCNCHGNLDPNLIMEDCDPVTGECSDCVYNTGGRYCERCADGFYGDAIITKSCIECECNSCGTDECDHELGHCSCKAHVIGGDCSSCEPGYFGFASCQGCRSCSCAEGALSDECNAETGQCQCSPNVVGIRCDKCAPGFWNYSPRGCEPCTCRNNGQCDPSNGRCECPPGVTGAQCDQCKLARHVLELGATECSRCDSCIDDLLDEIEPLTAEALLSMTKLQNASIGVVATQRLKALQDRSKQIEEVLEADEEFLSSSNSFSSDASHDDLEEVSGSGAGELMNESQKFGELEARINWVETNVSRMCNHTTILFEQIGATGERSAQAGNESKQIEQAAEDFLRDARDLHDKLLTESSGDAEDYEQKLRDARAIIMEMTKRDMTSLKLAADAELEAALEVLSRVESGFTFPAGNISERVQALLNNYTSVHEKLHELRSLMNSATATANNASTTNAVNRRNLAHEVAQIRVIGDNADMASSDVDDAERMIATVHKLIEESITAGIREVDELRDALQLQSDLLEPETTLLLEGLKRYGGQLNESIAAAMQLEDDAQALERLAETRYDNGPKAANRSKEIANSMRSAEEAAERALIAARRAHDDVEERDLQSEADASESRSSALLSETQQLSDTRIPKLRTDMRKAAEDLEEVRNNRAETAASVDELNERLLALDWGNVEGQVDSVNRTATQADQKSRRATAEAKKLEELIADAPRSNNLNRVLGRVHGTLNDLNEAVRSMGEEGSRAISASSSFSELKDSLNLKRQIISIRKRIELTRNIANMIKDSMKFNSINGSGEEFVHLRIPNTVQDTDKYLNVKFAVQMKPESPDSRLLYYGDETENGDYVSVESVSGFVKYQFKVGEGIGELQSEVAINNDKWHTITIQRWGNYGKLIVTYESESRGDVTAGTRLADDVKEGTTNNSDIVSTMNSTVDGFFMGGYSMEEPPPGLGDLGTGDLCVTNVHVNNETVGMWNYISYNGDKPGSSCQSSDVPYQSNQMLRFRGQGSYIRVAREHTTFLTNSRSLHFIGLKLSTLQKNSLVFLIGKTIEQFMALQVESGKLVLYWNFGFPNGPQNKTIFNEDITKETNPLIIKVGIARNRHIVLATIKLNYALKETFEGEVNFEGDIWLGGVWIYDVQPELRRFLNNIETSFRGCVKDLNINSRRVGLQDVVEDIGVTRGCVKEEVASLHMQGNDYVRLVSELENTNDVMGGMTVRSGAPSGTMMGIAEGQESSRKDQDSSDFDSNDSDNGQAGRQHDDVNSNTNESEESSINENDAETNRQVADKVEVAERSGNILPMILIVIGIVVGAVLIAAVISTVLKSSPEPLAGSPGQVPEQAPLNDVQAQRTGQMEW